jgi:2-polyprenyl-6-methoxyphenol hydroxylase-like FAD-dependent oxidoreductase
LVERLAAPPGSGLGLNLPGNAVRALAALGLADEVVRRGMRIRRQEYRNKAGRLLFAVSEEAFWGRWGRRCACAVATCSTSFAPAPRS